jgi:hypothetical protein
MAHLITEEKTALYKSRHGGYCYEYFVGVETGDIYLDYDLCGEAKYFFRYTPKEDKGVWLLIVVEQVRSCGGLGCPKFDVEVAGFNYAEAVQQAIKKILKQPSNHDEANVDIALLEAKLKEALEQNSRHK